MDSAIELLKNKIAARCATLERLYEEDARSPPSPGSYARSFPIFFPTVWMRSPETARSSSGFPACGVSVRTRATSGSLSPTMAVASSDGRAGHIFEPLFTTKVDVGTGLGLWVSKQIIEKHGGSIRVRSRASGPCRGTTFAVFFPAVTVHSQNVVPSHATGEGIGLRDEMRARAAIAYERQLTIGNCRFYKWAPFVYLQSGCHN